MALPPGPRLPKPYQTWQFTRTQPGFLARCQERFGNVFTLRIAMLGDLVVVADPALIKEAFTGDPRTLHAGEGNAVLEPAVGPNSILLLDEERHLRQRKLMLPSFRGERMRVYGDLIREITAAAVDRWPVGEAFALHPSMQAITLRVILRAVFGIEDAARVAELERVLPHMLDISEREVMMPFLRHDLGPHSPWGKFLRIRAEVDALLYDEIGRRRGSDGLEQRPDVLSLLMVARDENGEPMSDPELRDELMTLLIAGHETTATSLAWTLERLLRHPEAMARLRAELAGGEGEEEYLDAVIKETMRVRPVLNFAMRRLAAPFSLNGWDLPKGAQIGVAINLVHQREDIYPDAAAFRPERFIETPAETYSWLPFGGGIRRCLGAAFAQFEMKTVLREVLGRVDLRAVDQADEARKRRAITFVPEKGAMAVVTASTARRAGRAPARAGSRA